jgi:formylglycine-generating enzyme required for sulfatase activity
VVSQNCDDGFPTLAPVKIASLKPNLWFLHSMHGNVWEWVHDGYHADFYASGGSIDPVNDNVSAYRVMRGGSFFHRPESARSGLRDWLATGSTHKFLGFRCARAVPQL